LLKALRDLKSVFRRAPHRFASAAVVSGSMIATSYIVQLDQL
jgi:hypothetical protein